MIKTSIRTPKIELENIKEGDIFSEISHYIAKNDYKKGDKKITLIHTESGTEVDLNTDYVSNLLVSADQFEEGKVIKVGREDKLWTAKQIADAVKSGDLASDHTVREGNVRLQGIRTIWENIYDSHVLTVFFKKQDTILSKKKYEELLEEQRTAVVDLIMKAQKNKEGIAKVAIEQIALIQNNPILPYQPGEERILRGFKIQFSSRDGRYDCVDMDINVAKEGSNIRPVNINTISRLCYKGVNYIVE